MRGGFVDASRQGVAELEADYVVVGSGAGGGAAARVLASTGRSVVVLEEGPALETRDLSRIAAETMLGLFRHGGHTAALGPAPIPYLQGRCVGGTTFVNSAIVWRLPEKVLSRWRGELGLGAALPEAELESSYRAVEEELGVRAVQPEVVSGSDARMRVGAERAAISHRTIERAEVGCRGSGRCFHGCPHGAKQSTTVNALRRAASDGAQILAHAGVERVEVRGGRAVAVQGRITGPGPERGQRFRLGARRGIVVAASVVQSPNLLRRSKIALGSSALGNHFTAHPGTSVIGVYPDAVGSFRGASQGYEAYGLRDTLGVKFESINVPPEVAASRLPGFGARFAAWVERLPRAAVWAIALRADGEGSVRPSRLLGGDVVRYTPTRSDLDRLRQGMKRLAELHFLAGATSVVPNVHGLPEELTSPDELRRFDDAPLDLRAYSLVATHLFGTCRAGPDPATSVVDANLKVHGVDGLYVMDASVFPGNTGVNPQHAIMAWATLAARRLAG